MRLYAGTGRQRDKERNMEKTVILGLGNLLYGDEGFGVRLAQHMYAHWDFPPDVSVVDGGTQGQTLLAFVEEADNLLVLDAVDFGLEEGELTLREEVPAYLTAQKVGPHQNSFSEVLGLATLRGALPRRCALLGVQPALMTLGARCSPAVERALPRAADQALALLRRWGIAPVPRTRPRHLSAPVLARL